MKNILMKSALIVSVLSIALSIGACSKKDNDKKEPKLENYSIHHDDEFGGAYIDISRDEFNKLGFAFGDSIDITFSNNVKYEDIGYYSGYYVPAGQELLVGYPGYEYIKFCVNYGEDIYAKHNMDENTKATITLHEAKKYIGIEETLSISYSDDINEYTSNEEFANFREIKTSHMNDNILFRGASPIDNRRKRASTVDKLLEDNNIQYVLDLADNRATIDGFYTKEDFNSPYFKSLDDANKVFPIGMAAAYKADDFSNKLKNTILAILNNDGPYYIHCLEGKDRTGYVCMIIEAMCGATYDELVEDYFITYKNYYGIDKVKEPEKYEMIKTIHIEEMIRYAFNYGENVNLLTANYKSTVNNYLLGIGLTQEEIDNVTSKLVNNLSSLPSR
ncbi:MAG: tyrosine-protein phosphatase [Bacilli bacterium]|nr:tyrosine-protein phosphatase [Bacilli bacterium]